MKKFICKISYIKQLENGTISRKSDQYVVDAYSFTECEANLQSSLEETIPEYELESMAISKINDVIVDESKDKFVNVGIAYVSNDADTGKETKITEKYLIQADTVEEAISKIKVRMEGSVMDWTIKTTSVTPILEYFQVA
jgi:hypothetical protein